jgi:hypothetical protein
MSARMPCGWHRPGVLAAWRAWRIAHPGWAAAHAVAASLAGGCVVVAISAPHVPAAAFRAPAAPIAVPEPSSLLLLLALACVSLLTLYLCHRRTHRGRDPAGTAGAALNSK